MNVQERHAVARADALAADPVLERRCKPRIRLSYLHKVSPHFYPSRYACAAVFGRVGYGVTPEEAYGQWVNVNLLHIERNRAGHWRVFPTAQEKMEMATVEALRRNGHG